MLLWFFLVMTICFGIGFFLSAYGLWFYKSWGRILFLWLIVAWAALNIASLAGSADQYTIGELSVNIFRFVITALIPLWYLHRPHVKAVFEANNLDQYNLGE